jgi:hypothetical protein
MKKPGREVPPPLPTPVIASAPDLPVDVDYYRSRLREKPVEDTPGMEITGGGRSRQWVRTLAYLILFAAVGSLFVLAFYRFTNSLRVAIVVVAGMIGYMVLMGKMAEGRFDRRV